MSERHEEVGMTDLQFKSHLLSLVSDLERIKKTCEDAKTIAELDEMIKRFKVTLEG